MTQARADEGPLNDRLAAYVVERLAEFDLIDAPRRAQLEKLTAYVAQRSEAGEPAKLTFICTHNSRRSHLAQLWAAVAAEHFGIEGVENYSGGTEATATNPRTVAALRRAGFEVTTDGPDEENPRYTVSFGAGPIECFSKVYNEPPNPSEGYCAVMTCSHADQSCPIVPGAAARVAIPFDDPKLADDTPAETLTYDERCAQIAREMLYVFAQVGGAN